MKIFQVWDKVRSINGLFVTDEGCTTLAKELMIDKRGLYTWSTLTLRDFEKMPSSLFIHDGKDDHSYCITGEADEPVVYKSIRVFARKQETADEVITLLKYGKTHKGDDLMELAKSKNVIIYPVTNNGWLFYDGIVNQRHKRWEDPRYGTDQINMYMARGMDADVFHSQLQPVSAGR